MAINTSSVVSNVYAQRYSANSKSTTKTTKQDETTEVKKEEKTKESQNLGKTIGEPKLSKEAQKYYDKLKKKFGNYDFILTVGCRTCTFGMTSSTCRMLHYHHMNILSVDCYDDSIVCNIFAHFFFKIVRKINNFLPYYVILARKIWNLC